MLVLLVVLHHSNRQAIQHQPVDMVQMQDSVLVLDSAVLDLLAVLDSVVPDSVVDMNHHHPHLNQALTELVVVLVAVLVDLMSLVLLSVMLMPIVMEASIVRNSTASINKAYKLII